MATQRRAQRFLTERLSLALHKEGLRDVLGLVLGRVARARIEPLGYDAAEAAQPITGRGIGYKLFTAGLIPSMSRNEMQRVYRLLKEAREEGTIPWEWIVDETRELERISTWANPAAYARTVARSYRRDFWNQQPVRCEVWSEKGTVRGVLAPVLDEYAIGFRVMHGFAGASADMKRMQPRDGRAASQVDLEIQVCPRTYHSVGGKLSLR